jgi:hypothetical protein
MRTDSADGRRWSRLGWFAVGVAAAAIAAYRVYGWLVVASGDLRGPDFFSFYAAARLLVSRGGAHLYEAGAQQQFQDQLTSAWPGRFILLPYLHPPYYGLVIAPLGLLSFHQAYVVISAVSAGLLAASVLILARASGLGRAGTAIAAAMAAAFLPVFVVFVQGQSDMFILLPLSLSLLFWVRGQEGWAGVCAGLALAKPQLLILVPLLFLVRRSWRALAGYAGAALALVLASLPLFGVEGWAAYVGKISPWVVAGDHNFPITGQTVYSLRGLLELAPGGRPVALLLLAVVAVATILSLAWRAAPRGLDLAFVASASLVLSPYQNLHDLSLLVLPGVALAGLARQGVLRHPRAGITLLLIGYLAVDLAALVGPRPAALSGFALALYLGWERLTVRIIPADE